MTSDNSPGEYDANQEDRTYQGRLDGINQQHDDRFSLVSGCWHARHFDLHRDGHGRADNNEDEDRAEQSQTAKPPPHQRPQRCQAAATRFLQGPR